MAHHGPSFFGYGGTLVLEEAGGAVRTYHGNMLLHLYTQPFPDFANVPPPPSQRRTEAARIELFREEEHPAYRLRPVGLDNLERPIPGFRVNPQAEEEVYTLARRGTPDSVASSESGEFTFADREAAETLVSLQVPRRTEVSDLPCTVPSLHQSQESNPQVLLQNGEGQRTIEFIQGGFLPGNAKGESPSPTSKDSGGRKDGTVSQLKTLSERPTVPMDPTGVADVRPKTEPVDVVMDPENISDDEESIPDLYHFDTDEESCSFIEKPTPSPTHEREPPTVEPAARPTNNSGSALDKERANEPKKDLVVLAPKVKIPEVCVEYRDWSEAMARVDAHLEKGKKWSSEEIRNIFAEVRMMYWWFALTLEAERDGGVDWPAWKKRRMEETVLRFPNDLPTTFEWMINDLRRLDTKERPLNVLAVKTRDGRHSEDVEMDSEDEPRVPNPSPIAVYAPPTPPEEPTEGPVNSPTRATTNEEELQDLKQRVDELEERVTETTTEIRAKMSSIQAELLDDCTNLADLKWRTNLLEERDKKDEGGKRGGTKKGPWRGRDWANHRYPTRYAKLNAKLKDKEVLQLSRKEYGDMEERMARLEERIDKQEEELIELRKKLDTVEALAPKVSELSAAFDSFQTNQIKFNLLTSQEVGRLRICQQNDYGPRLETTTRDIASLNQRFAAIFTLATGILGQHAVASRLIPDGKTPSHGYQNPNYSPHFLPPARPFSDLTHAPIHRPLNHPHTLPPIRRVGAM